MSELVEFIRGCLDADEQTARASTPGPWEFHAMSNLHDDAAGWVGAPGAVTESGVFVAATSNTVEGLDDGAHIARHDPARVLAEVNAKRTILDLHQPRYAVLYRESDRLLADALDSPTVPTVAHSGPHWPTPQSEATLLALAQPFAGEPGWRDEWGTQ